MHDFGTWLLLLRCYASPRVHPPDCRNKHQRRQATRSSSSQCQSYSIREEWLGVISLILSPSDSASLRDSTVLSFSHATFIHSRHDYMFVSSTNHTFSCIRLITIAQYKLHMSTNKMYYTFTTTKIANRIFHSEYVSYSCILWCCKCVMGTSQQTHSEITYALWVKRFFKFIFFPIFFNLC